MKTVTIKELQEHPRELINNVLYNEEFFLIKTIDGNAVVISEDTWDILIDNYEKNHKYRTH